MVILLFIRFLVLIRSGNLYMYDTITNLDPTLHHVKFYKFFEKILNPHKKAKHRINYFTTIYRVNNNYN